MKHISDFEFGDTSSSNIMQALQSVLIHLFNKECRQDIFPFFSFFQHIINKDYAGQQDIADLFNNLVSSFPLHIKKDFVISYKLDQNEETSTENHLNYLELIYSENIDSNTLIDYTLKINENNNYQIINQPLYLFCILIIQILIVHFLAIFFN